MQFTARCGTFYYVPTAGETTPPVTTNSLLLEDGSYILLEDGSKILLEG
ncbi:MAG: hypothetical protein ACTHME_05040 [Candidatus Nitrosocosmicus sp.]